MYRVTEKPDLTQEDPELNIIEGETNYFRLNIWKNQAFLQACYPF